MKNNVQPNVTKYNVTKYDVTKYNVRKYDVTEYDVTEYNMKRNVLIFALCAILLSIGVPSGVFAKKLDKAVCKNLKLERAEFLSSGILDDMSRGPEWVKDNLPAEKIDRIKRYINLDARVIFQCPNGGGPKITHKKKAKPAKKAGAGRSGQKKVLRKKIRKKKIVRKKTSSLAFDPFSGN